MSSLGNLYKTDKDKNIRNSTYLEKYHTEIIFVVFAGSATSVMLKVTLQLTN